MKTTKFIIAILCFVTAVAANAQLKVGFRVGGNISNFMTDSYVKDKKNKLGLHGGITAEYMFSPKLGIQTAFLYSEKGVKAAFYHGEGTLAPNGKYDLTLFVIYKLGYLEFPLHLVYKVPIAADSRISFSAGPYFAYGVSGALLVEDKLVFSGEITPDEREKIENGVNIFKKGQEELFQKARIFSNNMYSPFDFGAGVAIGYEVNRFEAKLGCDIGIINIERDKERQPIRNRNIYISLGAKF